MAAGKSSGDFKNDDGGLDEGVGVIYLADEIDYLQTGK